MVRVSSSQRPGGRSESRVAAPIVSCMIARSVSHAMTVAARGLFVSRECVTMISAIVATVTPAPINVRLNWADPRATRILSADTGIAVSALKMRVARGSAQLRRTLIGAGVTVATIALIMVTHSRETNKPRAATVIACDTLRAIMHDTIGAATRDSLLPPGRCDDDTRTMRHEPAIRGAHEPDSKPEF